MYTFVRVVCDKVLQAGTWQQFIVDVAEIDSILNFQVSHGSV